MDKRTHNNIFYKVYEKDEIERGIEKNVVADEKKNRLNVFAKKKLQRWSIQNSALIWFFVKVLTHALVVKLLLLFLIEVHNN